MKQLQKQTKELAKATDAKVVVDDHIKVVDMVHDDGGIVIESVDDEIVMEDKGDNKVDDDDVSIEESVLEIGTEDGKLVVHDSNVEADHDHNTQADIQVKYTTHTIME